MKFSKVCSSLALAGALLIGASATLQAGGPDAKQMERGKKVFTEYCQTCHQATGLGLPNVFPPVAKSDFMAKDKKRNISNLLWGLQGEITVNGKKFNGVMPPIPDKYKDGDIADALTYVYNSFGNSLGSVSAKEVAAVRKAGKPKK